MATSIREQLLAAITTAVGGEYGAPFPERPSDLPATRVLDGDDEATDHYGVSAIETALEIGRGANATDLDMTAMRTQAHGLLADLITEVHADETFGGLANGIQYNGGGIAADNQFVFAVAQFTVLWHHVRGDPFTIDE